MANIDPTNKQSLFAVCLEQSEAGTQSPMLTQKHGCNSFRHLQVDFVFNLAEGPILAGYNEQFFSGWIKVFPTDPEN